MTKKNLKWTFLGVLVAFIGMSFMMPSDEVDTYPEISTDSLKTPSTYDKGQNCYIKNTSFQPGEEITYKLYYNWNFVWLAAGEVVFKVKENDKGEYHLSAHGKTYKSYEWFFKVRDKYDTYINKETLLPTTSIRNVREGKYRLYDKVVFDQDNSKAVSLRGKSSDKTVRREFDTSNCMHDILSIVYYARNLSFDNFTVGDELPIDIFMDKEVWPLKVKYKGKDAKRKVKGKGKFRTHKFSPQVISGKVFKEGTEMNVWVTDDENRIPVLIESPVSVGSVKVVLKDYKGLKHQMSAKVD